MDTEKARIILDKIQVVIDDVFDECTGVDRIRMFQLLIVFFSENIGLLIAHNTDESERLRLAKYAAKQIGKSINIYREEIQKNHRKSTSNS